MRAATLTLLFVPMLASCAAADGEWPSLARRPGETTLPPGPGDPGAIEDLAASAAPVALAPSLTTAPPAALAAIDASLTRAETDFARFTELRTRQRAVTERAVATARGAPASSAPWAAAQVELSRYEKTGAQLADLRAQVDAATGDLAAAAANGSDVTTAIRRAGDLVVRVESARAEHRIAFDAAAGALRR